jgi:hypothetical protein
LWGENELYIFWRFEMNEENDKEEKVPRTGMEHVRNAMQALVILEKLVKEMGGWVYPKITTKPSKYELQEGGKAIGVSLKLFFTPRLLCEYIEQHPLPEEITGDIKAKTTPLFGWQ